MSSVASNLVVVGRGGHRYLEQSNPFLSLSCPAVPGLRSPCESHTIIVGSRIESDEPGHLNRACAGAVLPSMKQVADGRASNERVTTLRATHPVLLTGAL